MNSSSHLIAASSLDDGFAGLKLLSPRDGGVEVLALGEVMLRFDPGEGRIARSRSFEVWEGGGEYNVVRGLRRCFGRRTGVATALVDNPVGRLVEDLILQGGVDTAQIRWVPFDGIGREARNGIYFLERGFGIRGGMAMMDRGATAISQMRPGEIDWGAIFGGATGPRWFHTGGVMAGLSPSATEVVAEAMQTARRHGVAVSFDCNYRPSLWQSRGGREGAVQVNRSLMPYVDVLFGHEGDVIATTGDLLSDQLHRLPWHTGESFGPMAERVLAEFPTIRVIASTVRKATSANRNHWGAFCWATGNVYTGLQFQDLEILDRVGGGDSFAAGVIHGLLAGKGAQWAVNCGVAHGALAMTTPGDSSMATLAEVERLMQGGSAAVQR